MSRPSRWMLPALSVSRPAIRRSSVDLPQPEGPTNTVNCPREIERSTPLIVLTSPNCFSTPWSWRNVIWRCPLLDGTEGEALHELLLAEPAEHHDRRDGQHGGGGQLGPEQSFRARVRRDQRRQRAGVGGSEVERPERLVP